MEDTWQPNCRWLQKFHDDGDEVLKAIDVWQDDLAILHSAIAREDNAKRDPNLWLKDPIRVPDYFGPLTKLLVSWCDVARLGFDATPLWRFLDAVRKWQNPVSFASCPSYESVAIVVDECLEVLRRIEIATEFAKYDAKAVNDVLESQDGWERGAFDLLVHHEKRLVKRQGFDCFVDLSSRTRLWEIFIVVYESGGQQVSLDSLKLRYSGELNENALGRAYERLREDLRPLGVSVKNRTLIQL